MEVHDNKINRLIETGREIEPLCIEERLFHRWRRQTEHYLLAQYGNESPYFRDFRQECRTPDRVSQGLSILEEIKEAVENGQAPKTVRDLNKGISIEGSQIGLLNAGEFSDVGPISADVSTQHQRGKRSIGVDKDNISPENFTREQREILVLALQPNWEGRKGQVIIMNSSPIGEWVRAGGKDLDDQNPQYLWGFKDLYNQRYFEREGTGNVYWLTELGFEIAERLSQIEAENEILIAAYEGGGKLVLKSVHGQKNKCVFIGDKSFYEDDIPDSGRRHYEAFLSLRERGYIGDGAATEQSPGERFELTYAGIQMAKRITKTPADHVETRNKENTTQLITDEPPSLVDSPPNESERRISHLRGQLEHGDMWKIRNAVRDFKSMAQRGENLKSALPALINALDETDNSIYYGIVDTLGYMGEDAVESVPRLIRDLNPRGLNHAPRAANTLLKIGTREAVQAVEEWERKGGRRF